MVEHSGSAQFWSQQSQVDVFSGPSGALAYETALIGDAASLATGTGGLEDVHVVGVGTGRELSATMGLCPSSRIHAWDVSGPMVEACRRRIEREGLTDVTVDRKDVVDLGASDGPADLVVLVNAVLCYLVGPSSRSQAAVALKSVLRPGGTIAAVVHQRNGRPDWMAWFALRSILAHLRVVDGTGGDRRIHHDGSSMLFHHYTPREMRQMLLAAGFDGVRLQSLRSWARSTGHSIPRSSPNPLLVIARRPA